MPETTSSGFVQRGRLNSVTRDDRPRPYMTKYQTTERLPYSAQQMFDLVASVDAYCEFMPLCERSVITSHKYLDNGVEELRATLEVAHKKSGISDELESLVHIDRPAMTISARSNTGPVRHLENTWVFTDLEDGHSETRFSIEYQMRNWPMQMLMNTVYVRVFEKISNAFRERAAAIYG